MTVHRSARPHGPSSERFCGNGRVNTTSTSNLRTRDHTTAPRPPSPTPGLLRRRLAWDKSVPCASAQREPMRKLPGGCLSAVRTSTPSRRAHPRDTIIVFPAPIAFAPREYRTTFPAHVPPRGSGIGLGWRRNVQPHVRSEGGKTIRDEVGLFGMDPRENKDTLSTTLRHRRLEFTALLQSSPWMVSCVRWLGCGG